MTLRVNLFRRLLAGIYRRSLLDHLSQATADAFGIDASDWRGSPFKDRLTAYAEYTAAEAARMMGPGAPAADGRTADVVKERLYRNAADLGADLRRRLGIRGAQEALLVLGLLYRQIGIDMRGCVTGGGGTGDASTGPSSTSGRTDIQVTRCLFADHYSESTCRVMSAMDAGVVDGLFGGASLEFSQRITDGSPCCTALIRTAEVRP
jgi:hypothetical protein